jgi:hypothetical protein
MRIQVIDEHGVLWSDHPVRIHVDPDHGLCDLCEKHTPVLFDVTIYPSDDFPILRCHDCVGDGSPGERLVGVATAAVPDSHDIYIIDPHGYVRLQPDQAQSVGHDLAEHLALIPQWTRPPQPRPFWPQLARLAARMGLSAGTASQPTPTAAGQPPPAGTSARTVPGEADDATRADEAAVDDLPDGAGACEDDEAGHRPSPRRRDGGGQR